MYHFVGVVNSLTMCLNIPPGVVVNSLTMWVVLCDFEYSSRCYSKNLHQKSGAGTELAKGGANFWKFSEIVPHEGPLPPPPCVRLPKVAIFFVWLVDDHNAEVAFLVELFFNP